MNRRQQILIHVATWLVIYKDSVQEYLDSHTLS